MLTYERIAMYDLSGLYIDEFEYWRGKYFTTWTRRKAKKLLRSCHHYRNDVTFRVVEKRKVK